MTVGERLPVGHKRMCIHAANALDPVLHFVAGGRGEWPAA